MGNCSSDAHRQQLQLVTASVEVLRLNGPGAHVALTAVDELPNQARSLFRFASSPAVGVHPHAVPIIHQRSVSSADLTSVSPSTTTSTTTITREAGARREKKIREPRSVEIVFTSALPHSRFCKRLRMRRTADFDRVVAPLVAPGSRLKVTYDLSTLMIHVIERDEEVPSSNRQGVTRQMWFAR